MFIFSKPRHNCCLLWFQVHKTSITSFPLSFFIFSLAFPLFIILPNFPLCASLLCSLVIFINNDISIAVIMSRLCIIENIQQQGFWSCLIWQVLGVGFALRGRASWYVMPQKHLLQNILVMLPIVPFTSATYVSKAWNSLCNRILYPPKLSSMLSLNPSPPYVSFYLTIYSIRVR